MMHVAINAQLLNTEDSYRGAGVSNYSQNLLRALGCLDENGLRLTAFINDRRFHTNGIHLSHTRWPADRPTVRIAWEQTVLPLALKQLQADLVHGLVNVLPLVTKVPGVVTVHDLSFLRMPENFPAAKRFYLARFCRASVAKARRVIAVSRQTADDLITLLDVEARKIDVVYNGVEARFTPGQPQATDAFRRRQELPQRFLLYLGTLEPRKNLTRLVEAFARWRTRSGASEQGVALVLAGGKGWYHQRIFQTVQALDLQDQVHFPGFIPAAQLPDWYRAAEGFVYPSLWEGFGLPVLEAMACGTPVVCSRTAGLLEVVGEAALTFAPEDTEGLAAAIDLLVTQPALRMELRRRGLARSARFSWTRAATETMAVYEQAI